VLVKSATLEKFFEIKTKRHIRGLPAKGIWAYAIHVAKKHIFEAKGGRGQGIIVCTGIKEEGE